MTDGLLLLLGGSFLYLPGLVLAVALRIHRPRLLLGLAPVLTIALLQLTVLLRWGLGTGLARTAAGVFAAVLVLAVVAEVRARQEGVLPSAGRTVRDVVRRTPTSTGVTGALLLAAVAIGTGQWVNGMGGLDSPPQEHDTVTHTLISAWIAYTGEAGPFEVVPTDLATGDHAYYYPAGAHVFAGMLSMVSGDPVSGFNATVVLVLGLAAPLTLFAAAAGFELGRTRPVFSGLAALLAVTLYRPFFQYAHDAGILTYAMGLALAPAVAVAVTGLGPRLRQSWGGVVATALTALALYSVHPSLAFVAITVVVFSVLVALPTSSAFRSWARERLPAMGLVALAAALLTAPWILASLEAASGVANYPEQPAAVPFGESFAVVAEFRYGGFIDIAGSGQTAFALVFWIGFVGCLTQRRLWPLAAAWAGWAAVSVLYLAGHSQLPVIAQLGAVFYNSWTRLNGIEWVIAPVVAGLGISALVTRAVESAPRVRRPVQALAGPALAVLVAAVYFVPTGAQYVEVNADSVSDRWGQPDWYRISPAEREAFDYLAAHRDEVGRVLNNGNDGSTFAYVDHAIPVVNTYPEGMTQASHGIYLMQHFNEIGTDPAVRCLVQRYDITHVLMSATSPPLLARGFPDQWVKTPWFDYPPGFADLGQVPEVSLVFSNSDSLVFRIDPAVLAGDDASACTSDPVHPVPGWSASDPLDSVD